MSQIRSQDRRFISWAQNNTCLLCKYSLALHKHFHHIIAKDDGGPDHYLNLVALCPNHHWLVERIKRHIIPTQGTSSDYLLKISTAALQLYDELDEQIRHTLDILSKPHELSGVVKGGVTDDLLEKAAHDVMMEDARLLDDINKKRPRIFLSPDFFRIPDDLVEKQAYEMAGQVGLCIYSEVITAHMVRLHLPYKAIKEDHKLVAGQVKPNFYSGLTIKGGTLE
jgi:hypothetical protein